MRFVHYLETERYLLIQWIDSEDAMFDTVPARVITPPEGVDVLDLKCGDFCQASYEHRHYKVKVMAAGKDLYESILRPIAR